MAVELEVPLQTEIAARLPLSYSFEEFPDTENEAVHYAGFGGRFGFSPVAVETDQFILIKPRVVIGVDVMTPQIENTTTSEFGPVHRLDFFHVDGGVDVKTALKLGQGSSLGVVGGLFGVRTIDAQPNPDRDFDRYGNVVYDPEHPKKSLIDQGGVAVSNRHENVQLADSIGWAFSLGAECEIGLVAGDQKPDVALILGANYTQRVLASSEGSLTAVSVNTHLGISIAR